MSTECGWCKLCVYIYCQININDVNPVDKATLILQVKVNKYMFKVGNETIKLMY